MPVSHNQIEIKWADPTFDDLHHKLCRKFFFLKNIDDLPHDTAYDAYLKSINIFCLRYDGRDTHSVIGYKLLKKDAVMYLMDMEE